MSQIHCILAYYASFLIIYTTNLMRTALTSANQFLAWDNQLQKNIDALTHSMSSQSELKDKVILYEDDYVSLQIDERGHEVAKIKKQRIMPNYKANETKEMKQQQYQKQKMLRKTAQAFKQQYLWLKTQYVALIDYLKLKQIYDTLPIYLLSNSQQIMQSDQINSAHLSKQRLTNTMKRQVQFANIGSVQNSLDKCNFNSIGHKIQTPLNSERQVLYIQKPVYIEIEKIIQIPVFIERIKEVEVIKKVELIVERKVEVPVDRIVQKEMLVQRIVQVQVPIYVQKIVEVPVDRIIEKIVEVIVERQVEIPIQVEKIVEVLVEKIVEIEVEQIVEVPVQKLVYVERIVEVPIQRIVEIQKEKIVEVNNIIQRIVQIPVQRIIQILVEKIIEVPIERIVEVPFETIIKVPFQKIIQIPVERIVEVKTPYEKIIQKIVYEKEIVEKIVQVVIPLQILIETQKTVQMDNCHAQNNELNIEYCKSAPFKNISQKLCNKIISIQIPSNFGKSKQSEDSEKPRKYSHQKTNYENDMINLKHFSICCYGDVQIHHGQITDYSHHDSEDMKNYPNFIEKQNHHNIQEIQELKQQNQILKAQLCQLKQDFEQLQDSPLHKYRNQQIDKLIEQNHHLEQDIMKYEQERQQMTGFRSMMQTQIQEVSNRNQQLFNQLISKDDQVQNYKKQMNSIILLYEKSLIYKNDSEQNDNLDLTNQLKSEKQQNQNLRNMLHQISQELQSMKKQNQELQHLMQQIQHEKQILNELLQQKTSQNQQVSKMEALLAQKEELVSSLQQQNQYQGTKLERISSELNYLRSNYQQEQELNDYKNLMIEELRNQKNRFEQQLLKYNDLNLELSHKQYIKEENRENLYEQNISQDSLKYQCRASPINRHKIILGKQARQNSIAQIKQLTALISNAQISKKLLLLIQQICLDADYNQRTNLQMKEMVVNLKDQIVTLTRINHQTSNNLFPNRDENPNVKYLEKAVKKYQQLLNQADNQKRSMLTEISNLSKENYQIKLAQSNYKNSRDVNLIEQLQFQLKRSKTDNQNLRSQNEDLKNELVDLQKEVVNKNNKIKLLSMNLHLKYQNSYSIQDQRR